MDVQRWSVLQEAFDRLSEMQPEDQASALRQLEKNDISLANEVRELLEEDAFGQQLPEMNVERLLQDALHRDDLPWPVQSYIGPYRLIKLLGEGDMGVVYLAERSDIAGQVAIKLLRDAWLSPGRRQRFAIEQQMMGLLNHSSIARIYDAGTTKDGTPWFVMEFSDGMIITEYARTRNATVREIMVLFATVCETVRYAHSLAIIHRDLKPSNILITNDGKVKLLDFGIAKQMDLVNRGSVDATVGFRFFTPAYAAPELQNENRVGVFTDIYSLGAILYQLVTGGLLFADGPSQERDLLRPSKNSVSSNAPIEQSNRRELSKSEWADIDAICMKSLDKEPENRYRSMDAMIDDIQAFLEDRPLNARKHAYLYATGKFLYRNRLPAFSIGLALTLLIAGSVLFTIRIAKARDAAAHARDEAVAEAARSARMQRFTESIFTGGASWDYPPPGIKVTQMLDRGRSEALQITGDPQLQSAMLQSLGTAYTTLGRYADAEPLLKKAKQVACVSDSTLQCADIEEALSEVMDEHDSVAEAVTLAKDAFRIKQQKLAANDLSLSSAAEKVGMAASLNGDTAEAREFLTRALEIATSYGHPTRELASVLGDLAHVGFAYNDPRALQYADRSAEINEQLFGKNSYEYARSEAAIGIVLLNYGRYKQAEEHLRLGATLVEAWAGPDEAINVRYMLRLEEVLQQEGKLRESRELLLRALAITLQSNPPSSLEAADIYFDLGFVEFQRGHLDAAEKYYRSNVELAHQHLSVNPVYFDFSQLGLATIDDKRGDPKGAETLIRQVLLNTKFPASYAAIAGHALLGHVLLEQGKSADAESELRQAYAWFSRDATMRPHTAMTYLDLAEVERRLGRTKEASKVLAELRAHPK